jgi:hypothetical protein
VLEVTKVAGVEAVEVMAAGVPRQHNNHRPQHHRQQQQHQSGGSGKAAKGMSIRIRL